MKFFVLCVILLCSPTVFAMLSAEVGNIWYEYQRDCTIESGADASLVAHAERTQTIPDDGRLDTFAICMLKKYNVLHKDGSVNQEVWSYTIISDNPEENIIRERCKNEIGKDVGETARKITNCLSKYGETVMPNSPHPPPTPPPPAKDENLVCQWVLKSA